MAAHDGPSCRLCVKNLPRYVTEARLRDTFAAQGEVTDVKVLKTRDGRPRQMAFVGFRSPDDAARALKYFHRSFMDTNRLMVEEARRVNEGSTAVARPWSKYSKGSSAHDSKTKAPDTGRGGVASASTNKGRPGDATNEEDAETLAEFMTVMQRRGRSRMWANDDVLPDGADKSARGTVYQPPGKPAPKKSVKTGKGRATEEDSDDDEVERGEEEEREESEDKSEAEDSEDEDVEEGKAGGGVSDMDYLRSKVVSDHKFETDSDDDDGDGGDDGAAGAVEEASSGSDGEEEGAGVVEEEADEEKVTDETGPHYSQGATVEDGSIAETGRLFLRNLSYSATEAELRKLFSPFGELSDVHLVLDRETRKSKGIAYVMFMMPEDAMRAAAALDATDFQGRLLHILPAKLPPHSRTAADRSAHISFKQQKEEELRGQAGNRATWNSLFMRQDTVAEAIAAHFGVSKSELLDRDTADLPVRMALGETHVIASTKKALGEAGVAVDTLEAAAAASGHASSNSSVARSSTCLLVKNLPFSVTGDELSAMFEAMGGLARLVLPPTRTIALVEYLEAQDAKRAFRALAYKRCHHVPLYLEWAPAGIFTPGAPSLGLSAPGSSHPGNKESTTPVLDSTVVAGLVDAENDEAATGEGGPARELYVKNLNFETRDPALRAHFAVAAASAGGRVTAARVALKGDAKHASRKLSLGYGFVELDSEATARTVLRSLQGSKLDGHALVLQLSTSKSDSKKTKSKSDESKTKLVCRNVAFEATRKDLSSLFGAVGQLKSLRLPKKFDGTHRGFAFVEFATAQETQAAIDAISGTHLYGRRLLVERAKEEDGLDDIRDKTATKYRADDGTGERPSKRPRQTKGLIADLDNM